MRHEFSFAGMSCRDFGIWCDGGKVLTTAERDQEFISIPGRSGDLIIDNGRWHNNTISYDCYIYRDILDKFAAFRTFLMAHRGYQRLEDTYSPGEYRMATLAERIDAERINLHHGQFTITFNCKPQRFLTIGESPHIFTAAGSIVNPTPFPAAPLLRVTGKGTVDIGNIRITISDNPGVMEIDCDLMDAYCGSINCNSMISVSADSFPVLGAEKTGIALGKGITKLEIIPRWFCV